MTIIWSDRALADFGEITSYNARFSATSSVRLSLAIADRLDKLDDHPGQGRMIPEVGNEQFREVFVQRYRIWYRERGADAELIAIFQGARDTRG